MPIILRSVAEEALEEARRLLNGLTIPGGGRGARVQGSLVSVTIDDGPGIEPGTREIALRCFVPGRLNVPWENRGFFVADAPVFLDRAGRAKLRLHAPPDRPLTIEATHSAVLLTEIPAMLPQFKPGADSPPDDLPGYRPPKPAKTIYTSADGQLTAEVTTYQKGLIQIELRTFDEKLGAGTAVVEFIGASGNVLRTVSVQFIRSEGFIANFELPAAFGEPASLRFAIRPAEEEGQKRE